MITQQLKKEMMALTENLLEIAGRLCTSMGLFLRRHRTVEISHVTVVGRVRESRIYLDVPRFHLIDAFRYDGKLNSFVELFVRSVLIFPITTLSR